MKKQNKVEMKYRFQGKVYDAEKFFNVHPYYINSIDANKILKLEVGCSTALMGRMSTVAYQIKRKK